MLIFRGEWSDSELKLETAKKLFEKEGNEQSLSLTWLYFAWRFLLLARTIPQFKKVNLKSAIAAASRALSLANEWTRKHFSMPSGYIRSYWVLGAALRANGDLAIAEENLSKAISICRQINMVYFEADILLELARLRYDQKK